MDELPVQRDYEAQEGAPHARERSRWFARGAVSQQRRRSEAKMKLRLALVLLSLVLTVPAAAHVGGAFWPAARVQSAVDGMRVRVGTRVVRVDADTTLCSGEGRSRLRRGVRTWTHFRCTFTTFTASGPGRDVEFRVHALTARRMVITNSRWILG